MAVQDTTVRHYFSSMSGAPVMSGTIGALISLLDTCIAGFGSVNVATNGLVVASNVATVTVSTGHGFVMKGLTGPVITIAGVSTPSALNGDWRVASVTNSTTFTFNTSGITDQTATTAGTITAKIAAMPMSKAYSGTNKAAYRLNSGNRRYLRIDDSVAQHPSLIMYESMSDVDTGTGLAPTSGNLNVSKSSSADGTARAWSLFADSYLFYLFCDATGSLYNDAMAFGDIISFVTGDVYNSILASKSGTNDNSSYFAVLGVSAAKLIARDYTQSGASIPFYALSYGVNDSQTQVPMGGYGASYPNPGSNELLIAPVDVWGPSKASCRGRYPGLYNPLHPRSALAHGTVVEGSAAGMPGRTLFINVLNCGYGTGNAAIDLTGPWR